MTRAELIAALELQALRSSDSNHLKTEALIRVAIAEIKSLAEENEKLNGEARRWISQLLRDEETP